MLTSCRRSSAPYSPTRTHARQALCPRRWWWCFSCQPQPGNNPSTCRYIEEFARGLFTERCCPVQRHELPRPTLVKLKRISLTQEIEKKRAERMTALVWHSRTYRLMSMRSRRRRLGQRCGGPGTRGHLTLYADGGHDYTDIRVYENH